MVSFNRFLYQHTVLSSINCVVEEKYSIHVLCTAKLITIIPADVLPASRCNLNLNVSIRKTYSRCSMPTLTAGEVSAFIIAAQLQIYERFSALKVHHTVSILECSFGYSSHVVLCNQIECKPEVTCKAYLLCHLIEMKHQSGSTTLSRSNTEPVYL